MSVYMALDSPTATLETQTSVENSVQSEEGASQENELDEKFLSLSRLREDMLKRRTALEVNTQFLYNNMQVIREQLYPPNRRTESLDVSAQYHLDLAHVFCNVPELLEEEKKKIFSIAEGPDSVGSFKTNQLQSLKDEKTHLIEVRNDLCATKINAKPTPDLDDSILNATDFKSINGSVSPYNSSEN